MYVRTQSYEMYTQLGFLTSNSKSLRFFYALCSQVLNVFVWVEVRKKCRLCVTFTRSPYKEKRITINLQVSKNHNKYLCFATQDCTTGQKCVVKVDQAGHLVYWKAEDKVGLFTRIARAHCSHMEVHSLNRNKTQDF